MSSHARAESDREEGPAIEERRNHQRHPGNAKVRLIRENDTRRLAVPVELVDISVTGLGVLAPESFAADQRVKVLLRNDIRRFCKEVHGVVRWSQPADDGKFRLGIVLNSRFTSVDLQLLKQVGLTGESGNKVWI
ncbi:MAG: PilZ domain-containing protein [Deltaproteobacteria bacterium]